MAKKKRKPTKRKKKSNVAKWWDKHVPRFLQHVGAMTIFFIVLAALLGLLLFRFADQAQQWYYQQKYEQEQYQRRQQFIESLVPTAQRLQRQYGVFASVSLAQAALESDFGTSELGANYHNLYGVKTDATDPEGVDLPTMEHIDDHWIEVTARFKTYPSWDLSMEEHARLIHFGTSWDPNFYQAVKAGQTYQEQAKGLQEAGYATDPTYADKVIQMIEAWQLHDYDQPQE